MIALQPGDGPQTQIATGKTQCLFIQGARLCQVLGGQVGIGQCQRERRREGSGLFQLANDLLITAKTVLAVE